MDFHHILSPISGVVRSSRSNLTIILLILGAPYVIWAAFWFLNKYGGVSLKPLKPWLVITCWLLWGVGIIPFLAGKRWGGIMVLAYNGASLLLGWVKRSYLFESDLKPSDSLASLIMVSQPTYVAVRNANALWSWYSEKFGLRKLAANDESSNDIVKLQFDEKTHPIILLPRDPASPRPAPVLFTRRIGKLRDKLIFRGVNAGPVQQDRQGTRFFEVFDAEGNTLEFSEKP